MRMPSEFLKIQNTAHSNGIPKPKGRTKEIPNPCLALVVEGEDKSPADGTVTRSLVHSTNRTCMPIRMDIKYQVQIRNLTS